MTDSMYYLACLSTFALASTVNMTLITVFYHRGLAHGALTIRPWARRWLLPLGVWLTGLDPKGWACMHRLHHKHSDRRRDPHSPLYHGVFGVLFAQLRAYERVLVGLLTRQPEFTDVVRDLVLPVSWLNRRRLWLLPYALHTGVALTLGWVWGLWLLGACYWVGLLSHPLQGWVVNALGHKYGDRNFDTSDNSRNNTLAAWLIVGEGYQNNHHRYPASARFSYRSGEVDLGYVLCRLLEVLGVVVIHREKLIPAPAKPSPPGERPALLGAGSGRTQRP
jgi:stearoyl-CoA desaturase (delta-9 desaturase)